jgi:hypothetical protein
MKYRTKLRPSRSRPLTAPKPPPPPPVVEIKPDGFEIVSDAIRAASTNQVDALKQAASAISFPDNSAVIAEAIRRNKDDHEEALSCVAEAIREATPKVTVNVPEKRGAYEFTIHRDSRGLITGVTAIPIRS